MKKQLIGIIGLVLAFITVTAFSIRCNNNNKRSKVDINSTEEITIIDTTYIRLSFNACCIKGMEYDEYKNRLILLYEDDDAFDSDAPFKVLVPNDISLMFVEHYNKYINYTRGIAPYFDMDILYNIIETDITFSDGTTIAIFGIDKAF